MYKIHGGAVHQIFAGVSMMQGTSKTLSQRRVRQRGPDGLDARPAAFVPSPHCSGPKPETEDSEP
jgi:hypothetical protein